MWVFLISGFVGSFIPQYLAVYSFILVPPPGVVFDMGSTLIVALFVNIIAGLLGGYSGYRLSFESNPPIFIKR